MTPPPPPPRLGSRRRTDPALTFAKLRDVVSPHCGIVTEVQRMHVRDPGVSRVYGYGASLEVATALGFEPFRRVRGEYAEIWRTGAEGRNGSRVAFDRTRAFVRAVGEALERYACCTYDPAPLVTARWSEVRGEALDPRACQMPSAEEYARMPGYAPFDPGRPMRWAWGWSLRDGRPRLVPAQLCWLMYNPIEGERFMIPTTSTGWALHHTCEEAIHTGLREIVERDAFFITWLNRLQVPRLDLDSVEDPAVARFRDDIRQAGSRIQVLVTTTDIGIPSFAVCIGDDRPGRPAFMVTLGAHPDPARGLRQAIEEAAMMHLDGMMRVRSGQLSAPERQEDIELMSHHGEFYLRQRNLPAVEWLLADGPRVRMKDIPSAASADVWEETLHMVRAFERAGLDALFVDATPPDLREAGWVAVKTLVPGTVRHEYGYGMRFLDCPRLFDAPVRMGLRERPLTPDEINPDAHPYS